MTPFKVLLLAAGHGTRLRPLTDHWPKCLMPIHGIPLLEYWLRSLDRLAVDEVHVNVHYLSQYVVDFLNRPLFNNRVKIIHESSLLGTAGTIGANRQIFNNSRILLIHADNFVDCDLEVFIDYHLNLRPKQCLMTMMTFNTADPKNSGIVQIDKQGIVVRFYEKENTLAGNRANGAIYLLEPSLVDFIFDNVAISDFSTQVIPRFLGKIATWHNLRNHIDIGTVDALRYAQAATSPALLAINDDWFKDFKNNAIHNQI